MGLRRQTACLRPKLNFVLSFRIHNSPQQRDLELMTQAFLTRLINLESQLVAFTEEQGD